MANKRDTEAALVVLRELLAKVEGRDVGDDGTPVHDSAWDKGYGCGMRAAVRVFGAHKILRLPKNWERPPK